MQTHVILGWVFSIVFIVIACISIVILIGIVNRYCINNNRNVEEN